MKNIILIDWLTFTAPLCYFDDDVFQFIGLDKDNFTLLDHGYWGYHSRYTFDGINVLMGGNNDTVCVNLTGTGCRTFESISFISLVDLIAKCYKDRDWINVTRIDIAYDDHKGLLDINELIDDVDDHNYTSRSSWWLVEYGSEGETIYFGSPKSNTRIRIYNKAAERGYKDASKHWIRVELQLRDINAAQCLSQLVIRDFDIGYVFAGILKNYLIFRIPQNDTNISRWPIADYWSCLLGDVEKISVFSSRGKEYNIFHLSNFVINMAGSSIKTYIDIIGLDQYIYEITNRYYRRSARQRLILSDSQVKRRVENEKAYFDSTDAFFTG